MVSGSPASDGQEPHPAAPATSLPPPPPSADRRVTAAPQPTGPRPAAARQEIPPSHWAEDGSQLPEHPAQWPEHPATPRAAGVWVMCAGVGFVGGQLASVILLEIVAVPTGHTSTVWSLAARAVPPAWVVVTELVGLWCGFIGGALLASRLRGTARLRRDMGLEVRPRDPAIGIGVGLVGQLLLLPLLYLPLEHAVPHLDQRLQEPAHHLTGGFPGGQIAVIAFLTVAVVPVIEEVFFRGLVLRGLLGVFRGAGPVIGTGLSVVATGVIFGLAHFELLELLGLAVFGVVLSLMAVWFRRLGPGIFAHATFNLIAILSVTGVLH